MKKIFQYVLITMATCIVLSGCEEELEERFYNPDETTEPSIEGFFTEMLDNDRVRPAYWELRTFVVMHPAVYAQSVAYLNTNGIYQQNPNYIRDRWEDFYRPGGNGGGVMAHYRAIENTYASMTDDEKATAEIFLQAAKVVMLEQAAQMVDLWGAIPFSEAGSLNLTGEVIRPKFDSGEEVYASILSGLEEAATFFGSASTTPAFQKQDILLKGDVDKWQRYANSLRLRFLMRTSFVNESNAQQEVLEILGSNAYPLVDEPSYNVLLEPLSNYNNNPLNALTELNNYSAPEYMLEEVLKPANDPRIPVLYDKFGDYNDDDEFVQNEEYRGLPQNMGSEQQLNNINDYAIIDSSTFLLNTKLPGILITASEVNFLKAEAFERWGGGDPAAAYSLALQQSVEFYYYLNSLNDNPKAPLTFPADSVMEEFLHEEIIAYEGSREEKLAKIWTQKWVHFGFLQSVQSWSEVRRTGYPELDFVSSTLPGYELPPVRLMYPDSERTNNADSYEAIRSQDTRNNKIFWDVN